MPDILVVPASNAVGDTTGGVILTDVSDPASALAAAALGLPVDTSLRFRVLGTSFSGMVTDGIAPVVVEAYTNAAGNRIFIPVSANVFGTEAPANWAVNDVTGGSATVDSVTIDGNMITLDLSGNLVMPGDAPTLDYTAGDIADGGGDVLASFTDREIINLIPQGFTVVQDGFELMIVNNDGSSFDIDDNHDHYDGTYSIAEGSLDTGPVALVDTVLVDDGAPAVGKTLVVRPPLFAYDPALGDMTISYTTSATNAVDTTLPNNPSLLIDAADADTTITVTATATQGVHTTDSVSAGVAIPIPPTATNPLFEMVGSAPVHLPTAGTVQTGTIDQSGYGAGDLIYYLVGPVEFADTFEIDEGDGYVAAARNGSSTKSPVPPAGQRVTLFEYRLTAAGSAATPIRVTNAASATCHVLAVKTAANASNGRLFFTSGAANTPYTGALQVQDDATMFCMMLGSDEALDPSPTLTGVSGIVEGANGAFTGHERWAVAGNIDLDAVDSPHSIGFVQNADGDTGNAGGVFVAVRNVPE